eukprot:4276328-Amphidinium_carterae.1
MGGWSIATYTAALQQAALVLVPAMLVWGWIEWCATHASLKKGKTPESVNPGIPQNTPKHQETKEQKNKLEQILIP